MEVKITHKAPDHDLSYHVAEKNNESDVLTFILPRYHGSLDLGALSPSLFLMREDGSTDVIQVTEDHILTAKTTEDAVSVNWTLTGWATDQPGTVYYQLIFRSDEDDPKRYATFPAKLTVVRSIEAEETLVAAYPTFFWQWDREMQKIREALKGLNNIPRHPFKLSDYSPVLSDEQLFPDSVKEPGNYYGYAAGWKMGKGLCEGNYLMTVLESGVTESEDTVLMQVVYFYRSGRLFSRFFNAHNQLWSTFVEISFTTSEHILMSQCKAERGFLFNIYNDDSVRPAGQYSTDTAVQTFSDPVVGDSGDVSFTTNADLVKISIANPADRAPHITNGVFCEWQSTDRQTALFPAIRVRMGRPQPGDGALGFDVYCYRDRAPLSVTVMLYACTRSLGTEVKEYGSTVVEIPNQGVTRHLRIPFAKFGIKDPQTMTDGTDICCKFSWNNANQENLSGDEMWIGNVGYFDETIY